MGRVKGTALGHRRSRSIGPNGRRTAGKDKKLVVRRSVQAQTERKKQAERETQLAREKLERIIQRQREQPAEGPALGAVMKDLTDRALGRVEPAPEPPKASPPRPRHRYEPYEGDPGPGWTVSKAWALLEQGYTVMHVMRRSGCGWVHFEHLRIGEDGRLLPG